MQKDAECSPQLENGYIKIANELSEAIPKARLTGLEHDIIWVVIRNSYGFNRKFCEMSLPELSAKVERDYYCVVDAIARLMSRNILTSEVVKTEGRRKIYQLKLNKKYRTWQPAKTGEKKGGVLLPQLVIKKSVQKTPGITSSGSNVLPAQVVNITSSGSNAYNKDNLKTKKDNKLPQDIYNKSEKKPVRKRAAKTACVLPDDFCLTQDKIDFAISKGISDSLVKIIFDKFCVHWHGKKMKDWDRTWKNWVLNTIIFEKRRLGEKIIENPNYKDIAYEHQKKAQDRSWKEFIEKGGHV